MEKMEATQDRTNIDIKIRLENEKDFKETEFITREAFWNIYKPGCDEHFILHKMRQDQAFVKDLDFVVVDGDKIIGNIVYSKAKIIDDYKNEYEVLCMGPFSVLPEYQKKGIGSKLLTHSINCAKNMGFLAIIIFGNPDYYKHFGFNKASNYGIKTADGENFDAFMALELHPDSLNCVSGKFFFSSVFEVSETDKEGFEIFDKQFKHKEKLVTDTQLKL